MLKVVDDILEQEVSVLWVIFFLWSTTLFTEFWVLLNLILVFLTKRIPTVATLLSVLRLSNSHSSPS